MPILVLLSMLTGLYLIFSGSQVIGTLWFLIPISVYSFVGNFAPFFEVGIGVYLDGRKRTQWLIPLLIFTFFYNIPICSRAFLDVTASKIMRRDKNAWVKTSHSGSGNCYIANR